MPKRRRSKAFWKNFKFKYKLTIVNENTLEEIVGLRVSKLNGLSVLLCVLAVLFLIASCIITFTPLRNYLPGYMNSEVRTQIVDNALRVDSLQQVLNKQNLYIMNIQDIFSGKVSIDSVQTLDSLTTAREDTLMERTKREEEFRRQYEENEKYNLTSITSQPDVTGLILYRPTRGMVSDHFNAEKKHYGTDIAANPNESAHCFASLASWTSSDSRFLPSDTFVLSSVCSVCVFSSMVLKFCSLIRPAIISS